ncbi:MAG: hypothetical protein GY716_00580 [bacterium]|nr:hypothetical protein [bacterium]
MRRIEFGPSVFLGLASLLLLGLLVPAVWAGGDEDSDDEIPFDVAEIFFELNNTDGDLGIHALIDGEGWKKLEIENASERELLEVRVKSSLRRQGLTEIFFESAEPTFDELAPSRFFRRFRAGTYEVEGTTLDGAELESETELTHLMPAPPAPTVNGEPMATQCDDEEPGYDATETSAPVTIAWPAVETSHPDLGKPRSSTDIEIHNYEVVVETEIETAGGEEIDVVFSVILPPGVTSMTVPEEFIALSDEFKYEVLVRESSWNQTATESCFVVED